MTRMGPTRRLALAAATLTSMLPALAHAHPGHGAEVGLAHLLTDPYHVLPVFAVAGIVTWLVAGRRPSVRSASRLRRRR